MVVVGGVGELLEEAPNERVVVGVGVGDEENEAVPDVVGLAVGVIAAVRDVVELVVGVTVAVALIVVDVDLESELVGFRDKEEDKLGIVDDV